MRTALFLVAGFLLLAASLLLGRLFSANYPGATFVATIAYVALWLVIAGVNMPMLIKLASARKQMDARALAGLLRRYGQDHIVWATEAPAVVRKAQ